MQSITCLAALPEGLKPTKKGLMPALPTELLTDYENEIVAAREVAEGAAGAALSRLAVSETRPFDTMNEGKRRLRRALRARARQLGGGDQEEGMPRLVEEIAYEQWHRLLFTRFLAENDLLMHPEGVSVSLEECAELAPEEGAEDKWELAARYAVTMLPGIFLLDDPAMQVRFAPEGRHRLEEIVTGLPSVVFTSDDGLGWAYQFWQSKKKDEVNRSERKIGGADIAPVTQLFTEDYMVKFLLHNSLGAWWAARHPESPLVETFDYLRYRDDGTPAAGTFDGWPETAAEVTMMDPCCGSGHFIVAAFEMLYRMRMEEEGLSVAEAGDAVIRDNLFGLEIDPRCTQIAAFNLALTAWKAGGYRELPLPNIACSGIPVQGQLKDWVKLAGDDEALKRTMERLYHLFRNAPDLGSLINPAHIPVEDRMFVGDFERISPLLEQALRNERQTHDPAASLFGIALEGIVRAAHLLSMDYVLVATNVPYLGQNKQGEELFHFLEEHHPDAKWDLATAFLDRCRAFSRTGGTYAVVDPENWLFLKSYQDLRVRILREQGWSVLGWLGAGAFRTIGGEVVKPVLLVLSNSRPCKDQLIFGLDVSELASPTLKAAALRSNRLSRVSQKGQLRNPDGRVSLAMIDTDLPRLSQYAESYWGIGTGDSVRFSRYFWEIPTVTWEWEFLQGTFSGTAPYTGREQVLFWQRGEGELYELAEELKHRLHNIWRRGNQAWDRQGVAISQTGGLYATLYTGEIFQNGVAAVVPKNPGDLPAIWSYLSSDEYGKEVRKIDRKLGVTNLTLIKVPFDLGYWQRVAKNAGRLPQPHSSEPTQWLFKGSPVHSTEPLHVAAARVLGYKWPEQGNDKLTQVADLDGIVCLPALAGQVPAAGRLRQLLTKAYGDYWNLEQQRSLLAEVGFEGKSLHEWLRDGFFIQHCKLFGNRPFIWQIWDGRRDGFNALVNYHKLDYARLQRLIYTYLGDWIRTQRAEVEQGVSGAEGRLVAALELKKKLEAILEGEPPYDIYVRWKPLHEQAIGWNPDLNDGVRLNIRPFVKAGVLRRKFTVHWRKDRGKNPNGSERLNDRHFTRAQKQAARKAARKSARY